MRTEPSTPDSAPQPEIVAPGRDMGAVLTPWLTTEQLAAYLQVSPIERGVNMIQRLMAARKIPFHPLGKAKNPRFHRQEIDRWLLERGIPLEEIA